MSANHVALNAGQTSQLVATQGDQRVEWTSDNPSVASVSASGLVSAMIPGTAHIIVSGAFGADTTEIVVNATRRLLAPKSVDLGLGRTAQLTLETSDVAPVMLDPSGVFGGPRWTSTDPTIVSVTSRGSVHGHAIGTAGVVARLAGSHDTTFVNVVAQTVAKISLPSDVVVGVGDTRVIVADVVDADGHALSNRVINWQSSNPAVATVDQNGNVVGISAGTTSITALSEGQSAAQDVVVAPPGVVESVNVQLGSVTFSNGAAQNVTVLPSQISASPTSALGGVTLSVGDTIRAAAVAKDANGTAIAGRGVEWTSLTPNVVTITANGVVTGVAAGTGTIQATVDGQTAKAVVDVVGKAAPAAPATVTVALGSSSLPVGQTTQAVAVARDASGNVITGLGVVWASLDDKIALVSPAGVVSAVSAGTVSVRATVEGKTGDATLTVSAAASAPVAPIGADDAEMPRIFLTTSAASTPSNGNVVHVNAGDDLQHALDSAVPGDRLVLQCGATFVGNYRLFTKADGAGQWITVESDCNRPSEGTRTSPSQSFAKLVSPNILPVILTVGPSARWRFVGLEITTGDLVIANQGLVSLGCAIGCETSLADQPSDIILDRDYIHGTSLVDVRRCVGLNGARLAVIDSYLSECHSTFDAQAVTGWNGPGPFKIVNNYLAGSTENVAFGGADPSIPGLVPSDIELRGNHITKPMEWKGSRWLVKNLLELKQGRRVLIDGNVFENSWPSGQAGFAFVLWSVNQQTTCKWCETSNVTIRNNVIRNVAGGWSMVATGSNGLPQYASVPMNHVTIRNNMLLGLNSSAVSGSGFYGRIFEISDAIQSLTIEHNTAFSPTNSSFVWAGVMPLPSHIVRNNLIGGGQYQIFTSYGQGQTAWDHVAGPGSVFAGNVVAMFTGGAMIAGPNWGPGSFAELGLAGGPGAAYSSTASIDQLALSSSSAYRGRATDGTDPGANTSTVAAATAGVVRQ